ncbi:MAG: hypothetical protein HY287_11840 [Planctomycetes bacterium]|nr:hypothetical protein [Planctomycetota bacterium]
MHLSICAVDTIAAPPGSVASLNNTASSSGRVFRNGLRTVRGGGCSSSADCNDGRPCTADLCTNGTCLNIPIVDCVECTPTFHCPQVEIVFIMDTSGSMRDEAAALCVGAQDLVNQLGSQGLSVIPHFLGITTVGEGFDCLTNDVVDLLGGTVPGAFAGTCPFPNTFSAFESWGPATAIVAARFPWTGPPPGGTVGATRIIIPMSDEGACNGSRPEGCQDPGPDRDSVTNAANVAVASHVIVSPIMGTGTDSCVMGLANSLASATGGQAFQSKQPFADIIESIRAIATSTCTVNDSCNDGHVCTANDHCVDGICIGTPIEGCRQCKTSSGCNDNNACTNDVCEGGLCIWSDNFDPAMYCCNPLSRNLTPLDDGNPCTLNNCEPQTGFVSHPPSLAGTPCNDAQDCTIHDACNGKGVCEGVDISTVGCSSDEQCFGHKCDVVSQSCFCSDVPSLCLRVGPDPTLQGSCHQEGEDIVMNLELGNSSHTIIGGQFRIVFDPTVLDFVDASPGINSDPHSPFSVEIFSAADQAGGVLFYAVSVGLGNPGTRGPATIATLRFHGIQACAQDAPCFVDSNPQHTLLTDDRGVSVLFAPCCEAAVKIHGANPVLACPQSIVTQADSGTIAAMLSWNPPTATGECDGPLQLACLGTNSNGADITQLIQHGGYVPAGTSHFACEAIDACGASGTCSWNVLVEDANAVQVSVQLSPQMSQGPVQRCIEFSFYTDCYEPPVVIEQSVSFGFPFSLPGRADNVSLQVPPGQYTCVSARDPKHTLRSTASLNVSGNKYVASFVGDPAQGGNWLVNGNLDGNGVIDAIDQAILMGAFSTTVSRDTPCGTGGFNADLNGDGTVNANDMVFIQRNYLATDMAGCCPNLVAASEAVTRPSISLNAARRMGFGDLSFADVNHDGVLNLDDIDAIIARDLVNQASDVTQP